MDKIIEKKTGWRVAFTKKALPWWLGALLLVFVIYLIARPNNKTLRVDKDTVTISSAVKGEFNDYIRISGRVQPMTTIQLSPQEGGIVEKILIEEGSPVKAGDAILILNNDNLDLQILNSEAELDQKRRDVESEVRRGNVSGEPMNSRRPAMRTNSSPKRNTLRPKRTISWLCRSTI